MNPQTTPPVLPDALREEKQQKAAAQAQHGHPDPAAGALRKYHVDDLFGVFPEHYFSKN